MNVIKTERRATLSQTMLNQIMRIKVNTPSAGFLDSEMSKKVAVHFLYGDKQRQKCTTKLDTMMFNAGEPTSKLHDKPIKRIKVPEPYNSNVATTISETSVKKPKLTQSALSVIKKEGTASCFFAPRHKKSEEQTKLWIPLICLQPYRFVSHQKRNFTLH